MDEEEGSKVSLSCEVCGIGGAVVVQPKANGRLLCHRARQAVVAPAEPKGKYEDIVDNQMVAVQYENPPRMPHLSSSWKAPSSRPRCSRRLTCTSSPLASTAI